MTAVGDIIVVLRPILDIPKRQYGNLYTGARISRLADALIDMIKIYLRNRQKEEALVELLHGETPGRIYTNFPIKGKTRKRRNGSYEVINSRAI